MVLVSTMTLKEIYQYWIDGKEIFPKEKKLQSVTKVEVPEIEENFFEKKVKCSAFPDVVGVDIPTFIVGCSCLNQRSHSIIVKGDEVLTTARGWTYNLDDLRVENNYLQGSIMGRMFKIPLLAGFYTIIRGLYDEEFTFTVRQLSWTNRDTNTCTQVEVKEQSDSEQEKAMKYIDDCLANMMSSDKFFDVLSYAEQRKYYKENFCVHSSKVIENTKLFVDKQETKEYLKKVFDYFTINIFMFEGSQSEDKLVQVTINKLAEYMENYSTEEELSGYTICENPEVKQWLVKLQDAGFCLLEYSIPNILAPMVIKLSQ